MTLPLYMDHNVGSSITVGLRLRGVDCLTAAEDGHDRVADDVLLERATVLGRTLFSHDQDLLVIATAWQSTGRPFAGLVVGRHNKLTVGKAVTDLELIAKVYDPPDMQNHIEFIPYP